MKIIRSSIRIIDYEGNNIYHRAIPSTFGDYLAELIVYINNNKATRGFISSSPDTEVLGCIRQILGDVTNAGLFDQKTDTVARRLLKKEVEAQSRVAHLDVNIQKGSLVQALIFDDENEQYCFLLAKVEHSDFVDDFDFSFKTGFSKDKKTIWKSCIIDLPSADEETYIARVYSNTVAKYWSDDFLEMVEMRNDENNTIHAFNAIQGALNRSIKEVSPHDHYLIRNAFIVYFRNHDHVDFIEMVDSILDGFQPTELPQEKIISLITKLKGLPEKYKFDFQFSSVPAALNAHIKQIYEVNEGIQLKITDAYDSLNANGTITACREDDGTRYIKIKTNNETTYRRFASRVEAQ